MKHLNITKPMQSCLLFLSLLFLASGCNNDDDTAPPITAENTFSCKINGELFLPKDHGGFPVIQDGIRVLVTDDNAWRFVFGNGSRDIYIYIVDVTSTGSYSLALSDGDAFFTQESENLMEVDLDLINSRFGNTHVSTIESGSIEVLELDLDKRIVLQFDEITLVGRDDTNETIVLSEGKLNINLETLFEEN